ncbi:hypothetical protein J7I98_39250 [Streptomyces sp. ISL-98]|uniref:hypothetical protein n=1 Tax=Streptomyces sp. ISL-98 TaxID=2819192 RepID=UPI001BE93071|nr:hypothetical protein [Streptomyces sp. ISL-98]MBT2511713.1 hypothetical protein [Streptomyces sp. ISL-98]
MKVVCVGLALAVLLDATVVRGLLVPAVMQLAGPANWWVPRFLRCRRGRTASVELPATRAEVSPEVARGQVRQGDKGQST